MLEVSDVEHRDNEFYVRVMANTIHGTETASLTKRVLVRGSLAGWLAGEAKQETEKGTRRLSRTPSLTGRRSAAVYNSRWVT